MGRSVCTVGHGPTEPLPLPWPTVPLPDWASPSLCPAPSTCPPSSMFPCHCGPAALPLSPVHGMLGLSPRAGPWRSWRGDELVATLPLTPSPPPLSFSSKRAAADQEVDMEAMVDAFMKRQAELESGGGAGRDRSNRWGCPAALYIGHMYVLAISLPHGGG